MVTLPTQQLHYKSIKSMQITANSLKSHDWSEGQRTSISWGLKARKLSHMTYMLLRLFIKIGVK